MQSVWPAIQTLKRRWDALPSWAGLLLTGAVVSLSAVVLWQFSLRLSAERTSTLLLGGRQFTERELSPIVQAFSKAKLTEYWIREHQIRVPRGRESVYLAALAQSGAMQHDFQSHTSAAVERFNIFESDRDRRERLRHARESDLAQVIRSMEGIEDALVQFDEVEQRGFQRERILTASVAVRPAAGQELDRRQIRALRLLVASAKAGMQPADVTIIDARSGASYTGPMDDLTAVPLVEEYWRVKRLVERQWQQKVAQVLSFIPTAQVAVEAELTGDLPPAETFDPQLREPSKLAISVAVPESYLAGLIRLRHESPPSADRRTPETLLAARKEVETRIRSAILGLVPDHIDMASAVTVTTFQDLPVVARFDWQDPVAWGNLLAKHQTACVAVVAVGLLAGLAGRWRFSSGRAAERAGSSTIQAFPRVDEPRWQQELDERDAEDLDAGELRTTLTELVRESPDTAAQILHRWMNQAG